MKESVHMPPLHSHIFTDRFPMVYDYFAGFSKDLAHRAIEWTFPRTPTIALASAGTGWYAYQYSMTYSQGYIADFITKQLSQASYAGHLGGHLIAPLIVPSLSPYVSGHVSLAVYLTTSLTLNVLAQLFFGIKQQEGQPDLLPDALKGIGIIIDPPDESAPPEQGAQAPMAPAAPAEPLPAVHRAASTQPRLAAEAAAAPVANASTSAAGDAPDTAIAMESHDDNSDLFGDADPVTKGCCAWKFCV